MEVRVVFASLRVHSESSVGRRICFVTFHKAMNAIKAKAALNGDPGSKFFGLIRFSRQPTQNHSNSFAPDLTTVNSKGRDLERRYSRWQTLRREEVILMNLIASHWDDTSTSRGILFARLKQAQRELAAAEDHFDNLVFQASRQADMRLRCNPMDAMDPYLLAYVNEKYFS
jgi:hypothetical protein